MCLHGRSLKAIRFVKCACTGVLVNAVQRPVVAALDTERYLPEVEALLFAFQKAAAAAFSDANHLVSMTKKTVPVDTLFSKRLDYILVPAYIGSNERVVDEFAVAVDKQGRREHPNFVHEFSEFAGCDYVRELHA